MAHESQWISYVRPIVQIGPLRGHLAMKVYPSGQSILLGYPFLQRIRVQADWTTRIVTLNNLGTSYRVQAYPKDLRLGNLPVNVIRQFGSMFPSSCPRDILGRRFGALLDSGCSDIFVSGPSGPASP